MFKRELTGPEIIALENGELTRPRKTFSQGMRDNPLMVLGLAAIFGTMFRGMYFSTYQMETEANRWMRYKNYASFATCGIFVVSAYYRDAKWKEAVAEYQKQKEEKDALFIQFQKETES